VDDTDWTAETSDLDSGQEQRFLSSPRRPDRFGDPNSLVIEGCWEICPLF